jgi:hypothetical protein
MWGWLASHALVVLAHPGALIIDLLLTGLLLYPLVDFLRYGWVRKKEEIDASLTAAAKVKYFEVWLESEVTLALADEKFQEYYHRRYGRHRFFWPVAFIVPVGLLQNWILAKAVIDLSTAADTSTFHVAAAAIAGAYTFVTWDFFFRVQRRALGTSDVLRGGLRLAMALPLGFVFAGLAAPTGGAVFLAYGIGVFPLDAVKTILRRLVSDKLNLPKDDGTAADPITKLSGVDNDTSDRIADADVATIPQLAWTDPIAMIMRTNLSFDFIVDIVSQALAWVYLDGALTKLQPFGLRGAYEIRKQKLKLDSADLAVKAEAEALLAAAATAINVPVVGLRNAFTEIAEDKATEFLFEVA